MRAGSSVWYERLTCTLSDLERFKEFLVVDLRRSEETAIEKVRYVRRFIDNLGKDTVSREDIREYLKGLKGEATYRNCLAALKVFFRDFCNMPELVQSFRFPTSQFKPKVIPTREDLRRFYEAIDSEIGKALFLFYATSGLRKTEVLTLSDKDVDSSKRMITPQCHNGTTKHSYLSFYNGETETILRKIPHDPGRLFALSDRQDRKIWRNARAKSGLNITPQRLREWFCSEMALLGVSDSYINAFCGRTPKSVLAKHYLDYSPEKLKQIYDKANLKVFA
jgi:integrase